MKSKIKVLIFEGQDASGKSSVIKALNKKSKYKYICIDRFLGSSFCYKRNSESSILKAESELANEIPSVEFYLIYLFCSNRKELIKRLKNKKDEDKIKYIDRDEIMYEDYIEKTYFNTLELDTSKININKCVNKIIKFVEKGGDL